MDTLNAGTKEILAVDVADRIAGISDLAPYNVEQKVVTEDEQTIKQNWTTVLNKTLMRVDCLIDTTLGGAWAEGTYKLYVRVNISPELPILGPIEFGLS